MPQIIRCKGNSTISSSKKGLVTILVSMCDNVTSQIGSVTSENNYDSAGALNFTVTVVMVYGIAVVGVFALGLLNRKKRNKENDDKEAQMFIKDYESVRHSFEQKSRVGAVSSLLHHIHKQPVKNHVGVKNEGLLTNLAFFALPLPEIKEEKETDSEGNQDDAAISLLSTVVIEDEPEQLCVFCNESIDKVNQFGPLCDNCMDKYKYFDGNSDEEDTPGPQLNHGLPNNENYTRLPNRYDRNSLTESDGVIGNSDTEDTPISFECTAFISESEDDTYYDVQNETESVNNHLNETTSVNT